MASRRTETPRPVRFSVGWPMDLSATSASFDPLAPCRGRSNVGAFTGLRPARYGFTLRPEERPWRRDLATAWRHRAHGRLRRAVRLHALRFEQRRRTALPPLR